MDAVLGKRWWSWQRLVCLAITAAILTLIFRRIDPDALRHSLADVQFGWFALAFVLYALALVVGGLRWHVTLHAIRCAVHVAASVRLAFIGHFFFLILFGAATGDVAKSALYARWYRFGVPELTASSPIDRVLGGLAGLAVGAAAMAVGFAFGGCRNMGEFGFRISKVWLWIGIATAIAAIGLLALWKPTGELWWARGWRTLRSGIRNFISSRQQMKYGLLLAIGAQLLTSAVFALNLRAVAGESLPWLKLAWTFPAVMTLSCLPITVAGAGLREMLSITFLGLYGVPAADCVGAALLTFVCKVSWSCIGGAVLWRESFVQRRSQSRTVTASAPPLVSVVIPAINEADSLPATVAHVRLNESIREIIVVDGGSTDRTPEIAEQLGCRVLTSKAGRGGQMRAGAAAASGDVILLLHADTWLPPNATRAMLDCLRDHAVVGGGFWKEFHNPSFLLRGSKWKCSIRLWFGRRVAGDQGMFIRRSVLEYIGGIPDMVLMEEFALCSRLRREGRIALADAIVLTSARRFQKLGVFRTYMRMWWVTTRYRFGASPAELRKLYEK
jgi:rSAM/selenodomain-associated transferase 2